MTLVWKKKSKNHYQTECGQYEAKATGKEWRLYDAIGEEHLLCFKLEVAQSKAEQMEFERKHGRYGRRRSRSKKTSPIMKAIEEGMTEDSPKKGPPRRPGKKVDLKKTIARWLIRNADYDHATTVAAGALGRLIMEIELDEIWLEELRRAEIIR